MKCENQNPGKVKCIGKRVADNVRTGEPKRIQESQREGYFWKRGKNEAGEASEGQRGKESVTR